MELVCTIVMKEEQKLESYATVSFMSAVYLIATATILPTLYPDRECNETDIH